MWVGFDQCFEKMVYMRKSTFFLAFSLFGLMSILVFLPTSAPPPVSAAVQEWQMGAIISSTAPDSFASNGFKAALQELANDHANYVTLVIPLQQADDHSSSIQAGPATPSTAALTEAVSYAHQLGLQVNLRPTVYVESGGWRAYISASDPNAWFQSYSKMLQTYADFAQQNSVEMITIGSELLKMTEPSYTQQWENLIQEVRSRYSGKLTYGANWNGLTGNTGPVELNQIQFWSALDYIGIEAYYPFNPPYTVDSLVQQWDKWNKQDIEPVYEKYNKPVLFVETGYRSLQNNLHTPWDYTATGAADQNIQATGFQAMFQYWSSISYFAGVQIWDWHSTTDIGVGSNYWATSYSPQQKSAEQVISKWFGQGPHEQVTTTTDPPPTTDPLAPSTPTAPQPPTPEPTPSLAPSTPTPVRPPAPAPDGILSWWVLL